MDQLFDNVSRRLAAVKSRREIFRIFLGLMFGTIAAPACVAPTGPSTCDGCVGSDGRCYTCSGDTYCTTNPGNDSCSRSSGGVYCCRASGGVVNSSTRYCPPGQCYIRSAFWCCPSNMLNYAGAGSGCHSTREACLNAGGGKCWYETICIP